MKKTKTKMKALQQSGDEQRAFGLSAKCFEELMNIKAQSEALKTQNDGLEFVANVRKFEDHFEVRLAKAIMTIKENGWPEEQESDVVEKYRKSGKRQKNAPPIYKAVDPDDPERRKDSFMLDHEQRHGKPIGPALAKSEEDWINGLVLQVRTYAAEYGEKAVYDSDGLPMPIDEDVNTLARFVGERIFTPPGEYPPVSGAAIQRAIGETHSWFVVEPYLRTLRSVWINLPLDCPTQCRNTEIAKIVEIWQARRKAAGFDLNSRDRWTIRREKNLKELDGVLQKFTGLQKTFSKGGGKQLPRTGHGLIGGNKSQKDAFIEALRERLMARHPKVLFNKLDVDVDEAMKECQEAIQEREPARATEGYTP